MLKGIVEQDKYKYEHMLGIGSFGQVWLAKDIDNDTQVAIKIIPLKNFVEKIKVKNEIEVLKRIQEICQRYSTCILDNYIVDEKQRIVIDYISGGTLKTFIEKTPRNKRIENTSIMTHLIKGMDLFHKLGVVNNDIKEENILLTKDQIPKYSDWGLACIVAKYCGKDNLCNGINCRSIVGTPYTYPPFRDNTKSSLIAGDIWSLGVVLYDFYMAASREDYIYDLHFKKPLNKTSEITINENVNLIENPLAKTVVKLLLKRDVNERLKNWPIIMDIISNHCSLEGEVIKVPISDGKWWCFTLAQILENMRDGVITNPYTGEALTLPDEYKWIYEKYGQ